MIQASRCLSIEFDVIVRSGCSGAGSALQIGTRAKPFSKKAVITLHGRREGALDIPLYGAKNIAVRYGTLDIHGLPKTPTWTRLSKTATVDSINITLAESVNWEIGDEIVVASSYWGPQQSEKRTIVDMSADMRTLTVDTPFKYNHFGEALVRSLRYFNSSGSVMLFSALNSTKMGYLYPEYIACSKSIKDYQIYLTNISAEVKSLIRKC